MSQEALQTTIVAVVAIVLLFQTTALAGVALLALKIRKPLEQLIANANAVVGIAAEGEQLDLTLAQINRIARTGSNTPMLLLRKLSH
jgi:hypothetical protein